MRVLVCGGRDFRDDVLLDHVLDSLPKKKLVIINGGAPGADQRSTWWAQRNAVKVIAFKADWDRHGPAAGPKRNQLMLDEGKPDLVIAFPGGKGTADMVNRAIKARVKVRMVTGR